MNGTQGQPVVGAPVSIRRACVTDSEAISEFFAALSAATRYLRFFGALTLTTAILRVLSGGGSADAVVASRRGEIVGHGIACFRSSPDGGHAMEIGVVVADAWQGRGIGSALVRALMGAARSRGATVVEMDVLHANRPVLAMIARHWPAASVARSADCVTFHIRLVPPRSQRSIQLPAGAGGPGRSRTASATRPTLVATGS